MQRVARRKVVDEKARGNDRVRTAAVGIAVDAAAAEAVEAFRQMGIEAVLLRGPAIAATLYDDPLEREYSDVDLLVQESDFERAASILLGLGYHEAPVEQAFPAERPRHATTWVRGDGRAIDLHRSLVGVGAPPAQVWRAFRTGARTLQVGGVDALIPTEEVTALVAALHAAHHGSRGGHPRRDLELARVKLPPDAWLRAARIATELEAERAFHAALRRRAPAGGAQKEELRGGRAFHVAQGLVWLRATPGAAAKFRLLRELLFPATVAMRQRSEIANRGVGGLTVAYALRLLDGIRSLPRALRTLSRIRSSNGVRP